MSRFWNSNNDLWGATSRTNYGYKRQIRTFIKVRRIKAKPIKNVTLLKLIENPNVRCYECSLAYNLNQTSKCPLCQSDRARLLSSEDPIFAPINILISVFIVIILTWFLIWFVPGKFLNN